MNAQPSGELTSREAAALAKCEQVIEKNIKAFVEVGRVLVRIRDERLYRVTHATFEGYCQQRWQLARTTAYQLVDAARVAEALEVDPMSAMADTPKPANERQVRPLTKLLPKPDAGPEQWEQAERAVRDTWDRAVNSAPQGPNGRPRVTARQVEEAVEDELAARRRQDQGRSPAPKRPRAPNPPEDRRGPLTASVPRIALELTRIVNRIEILRADDRFTRNAAAVASHMPAGELRRCIKILQDLHDAFPARPHTNGDPS